MAVEISNIPVLKGDETKSAQETGKVKMWLKTIGIQEL